MTVGWSRTVYLDFEDSQALPVFLACHERAFEFFGGVPEEILGPPGVRKTHLAVALRKEAVAQGHNVYFIAVPELLDELATDVQMNRLGERLNKLRVPTLLILDEMDYTLFDQVATSFLFQLVSKRYTKGSTINRLLHFSTTVNIRGESYRLKTRSGPAFSRRLPPCRPCQRLRWGI